MTSPREIPASLAQSLAAAVADLYMSAGTHIRAPHPELHSAAQGDAVKLGICIAATAIQRAMSRHAAGAAALRDLGYQPRLDDVQGE